MSERTLLRIFLTESDRATDGARRGEPLYQAVLEALRPAPLITLEPVQAVGAR